MVVLSPLLFAITTILERKGLGRIQNRYGPNRVGPYGFLQPIADGIKVADQGGHRPARGRQGRAFPRAAGAGGAGVPGVRGAADGTEHGRRWIWTAGVLFFFAVGAATELSVFMAGWSSRNKYSLLGAMRAIAQMISYEVPLILSAVTVHHDGRARSPRCRLSRRRPVTRAGCRTGMC